MKGDARRALPCCLSTLEGAGVQVIASWASVSSALLPAPHGLGSLRPRPPHQSPRWLQEPWTPGVPAAPTTLPRILASRLRVHGSFRAPVLPILHCYPEYPQNTISHALCSVHLKPFIGPHPAVFPEKSGVTALGLRTPL